MHAAKICQDITLICSIMLVPKIGSPMHAVDRQSAHQVCTQSDKWVGGQAALGSFNRALDAVKHDITGY